MGPERSGCVNVLPWQPRMEKAVAKGQKKSNREAKKPKKTDAERVKDNMGGTGLAIPRPGERALPKKGG